MTPPGHGRVQLRLRTGLTGEQYVTAQGWRDATLVRCPHHPSGGCSLARHGTYARKTPPGTRIARWYCPESHTTFSLLPDCLAARLPGTLADLKAAVAVAEQAPSLAAAADAVRRDAVHLPGAVRWLRRRVRAVHRALTAVRGLLPERLARMDTAKAIKATAHHLARLIYAMLTRGEEYVARDLAAWEEQRRDRMITHLQRQARRFDLALVPAPAA